MKRHLWLIKEKYYQQHKSDEKDIEIRVGYPQIKQVRVGDIIVFKGHENDEFEVKRIAKYQSFESLLRSEDVRRILPGATVNQALKVLRKIYPKNKESLGVYGFELKLKPQKREFLSAGELLRSKKLNDFSNLVNASYRQEM